MLTMVESIPERRAAWRKLWQIVSRGAQPARRTLGSRSGEVTHTIQTRPDLGVWMGPIRPVRNYLWLPFGTLPLPEGRNVDMIVQINPSMDSHTQKTAGVLAKDAFGDLCICHTGGVGGGREGITKSAFLRWTDRRTEPVIRSSGGPVAAFRITRLDGREVEPDIAEFVHEVAAFKSDHSQTEETVEPAAPFGGEDDELEHSTVILTRAGYKMFREHGVVRNRLRDLLQDAGLKVSRDRLRDVIVGDPKRPQFEFEVKPSTDPQAIYTAVGQLLMHSEACPARRRVAVLPESLDPVRVDAIRALGIEFLPYRKRGNRITFVGLDRLIPRASCTALIKPRRS